jgi:adenylate kinase
MSSQVSIIILLGPPGSGKGTQAERLSARYEGWKHVSTGNLFRAEIASGSTLGKSVQGILSAGQLVPDEVTNAVFGSQVEKVIQQPAISVLLLDGFPRTEAQSQFLLALCQKNPRLGSIFGIEFQISEQVVVDRVSQRLVNPRTGKVYHRLHNPPRVEEVDDEDGGPLIQRDDDKPETVRARFAIYRNQKEGILKGLGSHTPLVSVDATGSPKEVGSQLESIILRQLKQPSLGDTVR